MNKTLLTLILLCNICYGQGNDGYTKVDFVDTLHFKVTNLQNCSTGYKVRKKDGTWFITPPVSSGNSAIVELQTCGKADITPLITCIAGTEPHGIEVNTCLEVLGDRKVQMVSKIKNGYIEVQVKFTTPPDYQYYYFSIPMSDGTVRKERVELKDKKGDWYLFTIKL